MLICSMPTLSPLHVMICLSWLLVPPIGFPCFYAYLHACFMFMHEFCLLMCFLCSNTMELWTFDPKLHLSFKDTPFLFDNMLVCLILCLSCLLPYAMLVMLVCFMLCLLASIGLSSFTFSLHSFSIFLVSFFVIYWLVCLCLCMYPHGARAQPLKCKQEGQGCKHEGVNPKRAMFSRLKA